MKVLDNEGRVEVVLKENTQQEAGFAAFLKTTLGLDDAAIAEIGNGELEKAIVKEGKTKVAKWWKQYKDSQVRYDRSYQSSYDKVATFKIDTSTADGALAYSALLGLDITKAQEMSVRDGSGVTMRDVRSGATTDSGALDLNLMGHRVLLHKALYAERSGDVRVDGELIRMFRDSEVAHTSGNFLGGYETVKWGAVSVMKGSGEDTTTFYNLNYAGDDWITRETEIDRFFGFADALGVENAQARKRESSGMWWIERVFSARDNTKVKVDMYFTQEGVRRISESSYEDAQYAVLKACASLNPQVAGIESLTVDEFSSAIDYAYDLRALQDDPDVGPFASSSCLAARKYEQLTGRNLLLDADAIETAATFLAHKSSLGEGASDQDRRSFFTELGQEQRFRYKPAMVALVNLAGRDNALVGELSMVGEETELVARSEGTIERPSTPV